MWVSADTMSPTCTLATSLPTWVTSPVNSWPIMSGIFFMRFCAHSFQSHMCTSVPHMEAILVWTRTSLLLILGVFTVVISAFGSRFFLTTAYIFIRLVVFACECVTVLSFLLFGYLIMGVVLKICFVGLLYACSGSVFVCFAPG